MEKQRKIESTGSTGWINVRKLKIGDELVGRGIVTSIMSNRDDYIIRYGEGRTLEVSVHAGLHVVPTNIE